METQRKHLSNSKRYSIDASKRYYSLLLRATESAEISRFKTFCVRILARGTLLLFGSLSIHVKMCVLLRYSARK